MKLTILLLSAIAWNASAASVYRVAVGNSSSYTDSNGKVWVADVSTCTGTAFSTANVIAGTDDDTLYQQGRYGTLRVGCTLPLTVGVYNVTFLFAETRGATAGQRVMNISINGQRVVSFYDIYTAAGGANTAISRTVVSIAQLSTSMQITVDRFIGDVQLNAIEVTSAGTQTTNVKDYGAVGDGVSDDTASIQSAIDRTCAAGGGIVFVPYGTYLLNTAVVSTDTRMFYNLQLCDNLWLRGEPGTKLLQGAGGRHAEVGGAGFAKNTVVSSNTRFNQITWKDNTLNGGWYGTGAVAAGDTSITTTVHADAGNFAAGDYIYIRKDTTTDQMPAELAIVRSANATSGVVTFDHPVMWAMATPSVANVTSLVTKNINISDITIQGSLPLSLTEVVDLQLTNVTLITDTTLGGVEIMKPLDANTIRGAVVDHLVVKVVPGGALSSLELFQRQSSDIIIRNSEIYALSVGFGEYAARIRMENNRFNLVSTASLTEGILIMGKDVLFARNRVDSYGLAAAGAGLIVDYTGAGGEEGNYGQVRIIDNTITLNTAAVGSGTAAILAKGNDMLVQNNDISTTIGSFYARCMLIEGTNAPDMRILGNRFRTKASDDCLVINPGGTTDSIVVADNYLAGSSGTGLLWTNPGSPRSGPGHSVTNNIITGYTTASNLSATAHPDSRQYNNPGIVDIIPNCSSAASPAVCGNKPSGSVVVADAATTVVVNTTAVTANSQILLTPDQSLGTKLGVTCNTTYTTAVVSARTAGTSFTITISADPAGANPVCLSYQIVN